MLRLSRTFEASREKVFDAWTRPESLRTWWGLTEGYSTPIVEVDLRVGGRYRLGMSPPDEDQIHTVGGGFEQVLPPEKLVYTWAWEAEDDQAGPTQQATRVTVEFFDRDGLTELVLTHELFPDEETSQQHRTGWSSMLERLETVLSY